MLLCDGSRPSEQDERESKDPSLLRSQGTFLQSSTRAGSPLECSPPTPLWCSSGSSEEDKNWRTQPPRGHVLFHNPSIFISFQVSSRNWLLYFTQMFSVVISRGDRSALLHLRTRSQKNLYVKLNIYGHT